MADEVRRGRCAEHDLLRRPEPPHAHRQDEREHERDQRDRAGRQRRDPGRIGQLVHAAEDTSDYSRKNAASYSEVLLSFFSSPGTGLTCTVIVTGVSSGGSLVEPERRRRRRPRGH